VQENWNDFSDCRITRYFFDYECSGWSAVGYLPGRYNFMGYTTIYRNPAANQDCSASQGSTARVCACNYATPDIINYFISLQDNSACSNLIFDILVNNTNIAVADNNNCSNSSGFTCNASCCTPNRVNTSWSACVGGFQNRTEYDNNSCAGSVNITYNQSCYTSSGSCLQNITCIVGYNYTITTNESGYCKFLYGVCSATSNATNEVWVCHCLTNTTIVGVYVPWAVPLWMRVAGASVAVILITFAYYRMRRTQNR
jgi:hypothetical protein